MKIEMMQLQHICGHSVNLNLCMCLFRHCTNDISYQQFRQLWHRTLVQ